MTSDENLVWFDGKDLPLEGRGYADPTESEHPYDRLPFKRKDVIPEAVWDLQKHTAGMCVRFSTDSDVLRIYWKPRFESLCMWHMPSTGMSGIDVYQFGDNGWQFVKPPWPAMPNYEGNEFEWSISADKPVTIYFPLYNGLSEFRVGIKSGASIKPLGLRKSGIDKPVVFYGTSITQGGCVSRPGLCLTSIAGRVADVPVVNLGFSGSGRMELEMVDVIADVDASLYVLDTISNVNQDDIKERYEEFVRRLKAKRPEVPIILTANGWIFDQRHIESADLIRGIFEKLKAEDPVMWADLAFTGDYGSGIAPDAEGTVDGVHVNDIGSLRVGIDFGNAIRSMLKI